MSPRTPIWSDGLITATRLSCWTRMSSQKSWSWSFLSTTTTHRLSVSWTCTGSTRRSDSRTILCAPANGKVGAPANTSILISSADTLICCGWSRSLRTLLAREQIWQGQRACQDRGCGWSRAWWLRRRHGSFAWWTRPQPGAVPSPVRSVSNTMYPSMSQKDIPVILRRVNWLIFFRCCPRSPSQVLQPSEICNFQLTSDGKYFWPDS